MVICFLVSSILGLSKNDFLETASSIKVEASLEILNSGSVLRKYLNTAEDLAEAWEMARIEARAAFGNDAVYMEKYMDHLLHPFGLLRGGLCGESSDRL